MSEIIRVCMKGDAVKTDDISMKIGIDNSVKSHWEYIDNQSDMTYIKECAESVGIEVTNETAFSIPFIAEVMRKMREQSVRPYLNKIAVKLNELITENMEDDNGLPIPNQYAYCYQEVLEFVDGLLTEKGGTE